MLLYRQKLYSTDIKKNYLNNNFSTEKDKKNHLVILICLFGIYIKIYKIFICLFGVKLNHFFISIFLVLNLYNRIET